jgi:hypothetical protein
LAPPGGALDDVSVLPTLWMPTSWIGALMASFARVSSIGAFAKTVVRFCAHHTGLPVLVVAALLVVVGYRILKRTARFAMEVAVIGALLLTATELGWIRW